MNRIKDKYQIQTPTESNNMNFLKATPRDNPTSTPTQPDKDYSKDIRAVEWQGTKKIRVTTRPKPLITTSKDAIIRVTSSTICGSDLHFYNGAMPGMEKGDILGHECMGIVESVGNDVHNLRVGQRVVVSAVIADGTCDFCKEGLFSLCDTTNPSGVLSEMLGGHRIAGIFGYSHLMGGYPGGQADYIRVPFADVNCLLVPDNLPDEKVLFLSDVLPTAWHANELGGVTQGKTVAIWGAGPIGLTCAAWARVRCASKVVIIDRVQYRLDKAKHLFQCDTINFAEEDPRKALENYLPGGPDICIDAVGFRYTKSFSHKIEKMLSLETDSLDSLSEAIYAAKKGGTVVAIGDYIGLANHFPIGPLMEKGLKLTGSQVHVQKYWHKILELIQKEYIDPTFLVSKIMTLEQAAEAYQLFDEKKEDIIKIILKPKLIAANP